MTLFRQFALASLIVATGAWALAKASVVTMVDVVRVIDGDTVEIKIDGSLQKLRLQGIDAPEIDQEWGQEARQQLKNMAEGQKAIVWDSGLKDRYGRTLGSLAVDGTDAGLFLIEKGFAWHFETYGQMKLPEDWNTAYRLAQEEANYESLGVWSSASPVPPWTWRKHKYEIQRIEWYSYSESLQGVTAELQETFSKFGRVIFDEDSELGTTKKKASPALDRDNFIEEKEPPTWWQLFVKLGEGISRWISALLRSSL